MSNIHIKFDMEKNVYIKCTIGLLLLYVISIAELLAACSYRVCSFVEGSMHFARIKLNLFDCSRSFVPFFLSFSFFFFFSTLRQDINQLGNQDTQQL